MRLPRLVVHFVYPFGGPLCLPHLVVHCVYPVWWSIVFTPFGDSTAVGTQRLKRVCDSTAVGTQSLQPRSELSSEQANQWSFKTSKNLWFKKLSFQYYFGIKKCNFWSKSKSGTSWAPKHNGMKLPFFGLRRKRACDSTAVGTQSLQPRSELSSEQANQWSFKTSKNLWFKKLSFQYYFGIKKCNFWSKSKSGTSWAPKHNGMKLPFFGLRRKRACDSTAVGTQSP